MRGGRVCWGVVERRAVMSDHGLLLTAENVRAVLAGRKTQTRRIVTPRNSYLNGHPFRKGDWELLDWSRAWVDPGPSPAGNAGPYWKVPMPHDESVQRVYPRVQVGDTLWFKETWHTDEPDLAEARAQHEDVMSPSPVYYRATDDDPAAGFRWRSPIHMPRWACRLEREVTAVKAEFVEDISEDDAKAEGSYLDRCECLPRSRDRTPMDAAFTLTSCHIHGQEYRALWASIHGKKHPWGSRVPVWAYGWENPA